MIHEQVEMFNLLMNAIWDSENYYVVHVDASSSIGLFDQVEIIVKSLPNVHLLESKRIVWAGYSIVDCELRAIMFLLKLADDWKYFINLSGRDFPLKSQHSIKEFLRAENKNFMHYCDIKSEWEGALDRVEDFHVEKNGALNSCKEVPAEIKKSRDQFYNDNTAYGGSQWFILSYDICKFINNPKNNESVIDIYRNTFASDEGFFQTLLINSEFKTKITNNNMRYLIFPEKSGGHPKILANDDYQQILQSKALFARKFDINNSRSLISNIIKRLH